MKGSNLNKGILKGPLINPALINPSPPSSLLYSPRCVDGTAGHIKQQREEEDSADRLAQIQYSLCK